MFRHGTSFHVNHDHLDTIRRRWAGGMIKRTELIISVISVIRAVKLRQPAERPNGLLPPIINQSRLLFIARYPGRVPRPLWRSDTRCNNYPSDRVIAYNHPEIQRGSFSRIPRREKLFLSSRFLLRLGSLTNTR